MLVSVRGLVREIFGVVDSGHRTISVFDENTPSIMRVNIVALHNLVTVFELDFQFFSKVRSWAAHGFKIDFDILIILALVVEPSLHFHVNFGLFFSFYFYALIFAIKIHDVKSND